MLSEFVACGWWLWRAVPRASCVCLYIALGRCRRERDEPSCLVTTFRDAMPRKADGDFDSAILDIRVCMCVTHCQRLVVAFSRCVVQQECAPARSPH